MSQTTTGVSLCESGMQVRSRYDTAMIGEIPGRSWVDGYGLMVQVHVHGQLPCFEWAAGLKPAEVELGHREQVLSGKFASARRLRRRLSSVHLAGQRSELLSDPDTTDSQFMSYQLKPLLALLGSPWKGVHVVGEVGLGNTIEVGLIWTEHRVGTRKIPGNKVGRFRKFKREDVDAWVRDGGAASGSDEDLKEKPDHE